jgi:hypothetical protein
VVGFVGRIEEFTIGPKGLSNDNEPGFLILGVIGFVGRIEGIVIGPEESRNDNVSTILILEIGGPIGGRILEVGGFVGQIEEFAFEIPIVLLLKANGFIGRIELVVGSSEKAGSIILNEETFGFAI